MSFSDQSQLPLLPLRDIVVFPHMIVPLFVGREKSIKALENVMGEDKKVFLIAQKDGSIEDPKENDLYKIGTIGNVLQLLKLPDGTVKSHNRRSHLLLARLCSKSAKLECLTVFRVSTHPPSPLYPRIPTPH